MSSALSSVRTRRTNPQPNPATNNTINKGGPVHPPNGNRNIPPSYPTPQFTQSTPSPSSSHPQTSSSVGQTSGLSLHQIIDIYGKRLLQLEAFMNKTKHLTESSPQHSSSSSSTTNTGISLQDVQLLVDSKIALHQQKIDKEQENSKNTGTIHEEIIQDFHSRFEMLANEIAEMKDTVLQLQKYTMSVNKVLIENSGLLENRLNNDILEENETLGNITENVDMEEHNNVDNFYDKDTNRYEENQYDEDLYESEVELNLSNFDKA